MRTFELGFVCLWVVGILCGTCTGASGNETNSRPDYSKPLFTRFQSPMCETRDDLATLIDLARTDQKDLLEQVRGCKISQDGVRVVVLDQEGILNVWMRVRLMMPDGNQPIFWTVGRALRNSGPTIRGNPEAGKARVCITKGNNDTNVPALTMFRNAGHLIGDLQDKWLESRVKSEIDYEHAALVTTEAADLTRDKPCVEVRARMFLRDGFTVDTWPASFDNVWDFDHVLGYTIGTLAQPGTLDLIREQIGLRAVVVVDIGNSLSTSEKEAVQIEPDNPLNQIPADPKLAEAAPLGGPDRKGNFRICLSKDVLITHLAQPNLL